MKFLVSHSDLKIFARFGRERLDGITDSSLMAMADELHRSGKAGYQ
ncbi:hypothetical protein M3557_11305 [Bhargavaea ginsengi]|nr:hypothetical protein [Bhargavaea ginsengi]MCM3088506.1 hypothetical protein [Bhargavaea ginsengi]